MSQHVDTHLGGGHEFALLGDGLGPVESIASLGHPLPLSPTCALNPCSWDLPGMSYGSSGASFVDSHSVPRDFALPYLSRRGGDLPCPSVDTMASMSFLPPLTLPSLAVVPAASLRTDYPSPPVCPSVQPFHALIWPLEPERFLAITRAFAARAEATVADLPRPAHTWIPPSPPAVRLRVGYVSSDLCNHPFSHLTQSVYGMHRLGSTVECFCYSLSPSDGSVWRNRIESECEPGHFRDISALSVLESASVIAGDGIHILVNCNGYTKGARTELFALKPAPVQVAFMGFAGSLGASYIEYFLTDRVTSPPQLAHRMHSEKLLYHPHSYFVNDHKQTSCPGPRSYPTGPLTRSHYGLPDDCFLFCNCNQLYKLDPETLDTWVRILKRVPRSKLWLLRFPATAEFNVRAEARARGLDDSRIVFTDCAPKEEHVARCGLADLFLDTPICNAHTSGTDALWSGLPLLTVAGKLFASRVAASLVTAAGLPELATPSLQVYEEMAVELATNPSLLRAMRARLESSRACNPLFDTLRWVRNTEQLYVAAWRRHEAGLPPDDIFGVDVFS
jgi:protein O-GlcNAc transferase